jgi:peroxiredoxin
MEDRETMKTVKMLRTVRILGILALGAGLLAAPTMVMAADMDLSVQMGEVAPDFTSLATSGRTISLSEQAGSPVLMAFWSDWCSLEKTELSFIKQVQESYPDVQVIIVDSESEKPSIKTLSRIWNTLEEWNIQAQVVVDKGLEVTSLYEVTTLPTSLVIDPSGRIVHRQANYFKGAGEEVKASLDRAYSISMVK